MPKCEDRRRPPYFERSENAAPIRRSSDGQQMLNLSCSSNRAKRDSYVIVHVSLSAKIGDGRHISSEARTRPLFADRATGSIYSLLSCSSNRVKRDYNVLPFMSEANNHVLYVSLSAKIGDGRHISSEARTRPLFADRATGSIYSLLSCSSNRVKRDYNVLPSCYSRTELS